MIAITTITSRLSSQALRARLNSFGIIHLSVFGSYARGEATLQSDLDLLIDLKSGHSVTLGVLGEIEELLKKELSVPNIDFITTRSLNPRLKPYIEKDIITVF